MPPIASNARMHYDLINSQADPFDYLADIPKRAEPFFETEWLDFKSEPKDDNDAKRLWSRALSGFANTNDGLLIWGINCRPTGPRKLDAPFELRLVRDPLALEQKLRDWIRDATNAPVKGVEFKSYSQPSGEGFVVCLIPESSHKPHRSEWGGEQYYIRTSDDFLVPVPGHLRLLFYPRALPRFEIITTMEYESTGEHRNALYRFRCYAQVDNTGLATAKNVTIAVNWNVPDTAGATADTLWRRIPGSRYIHAFMTNSDIHPGFYSNFYVTDRWPVGKRFFTFPESGAREYRPGFEDIVIDYFVFAENFEPQRHRVVFSEEDFVVEKLVRRKADVVEDLGDGVTR